VGGDGFGKRSATRNPQRSGGIRPHVWIAAGALIAPAAAVLVALQPFGATDPAAASAVEHSSAGVAAAPKLAIAPAFRSVPTAADARGTAQAVAVRSTIARELTHANASASSAAARARFDSRLDADLRILEDEAARRVASRDLPDPAAAADDASRAERADAFLVEHFVRDAYRGTDFPIGYPAAQRTREAAVSRVAALDPVQRSAQLEVALQQEPEEPGEPRFESPASGLVWEAALR